MSKLSCEAEKMAEKMDALSKEIDAFTQRRLDALPASPAWALLRASCKLLSAASKIQLKAAQRTVVNTKKSLSATAR